MIQIEVSADGATYKLVIGDTESESTKIEEELECEIEGVGYLVRPVEGEELDFEVFTEVAEDGVEIVEVEEDDDIDDSEEETDDDEDEQPVAE